MKKRKKIGAAQVRLSILSSMPPCPGRSRPLSLTFASLFNMLSNKSPMTDASEIIIDKIP